MLAVLHEGASCSSDEVSRHVLRFTVDPDQSLFGGFIKTESRFPPTNGPPFDLIEVRWNQSDGAGIHNGLQF
jgi:hypothetical protein